MLSPKSLSIFCLCFVQLALIKAKSPQVKDVRIVGGSTTTIAQHPYIVQVLYQNDFLCGGSIITSKLVVTAAHCVYGRNHNQYKVRGGATFLTGSDGVTRDVTRVIMSSLYNTDNNNMDVATLELSRDLVGPNIKPISLITSAVPIGATVTASGWGYTQQNRRIPSNQLRTVQLNVIPTSTCRAQYARRRLQVTENMICATQPGKDTCQGDSGGPLTYNGQLAGIVSWGDGCAQPNSPGVYADILKVKNFINGVRRRL